MRNGAGGDPKSGSSGGGKVRSAVQGVIKNGASVGESTIQQEEARNRREAQSQVQIAEGKNIRVRETSREARREAMRMQAIPTSSQPGEQSKNESGRSYDYKVPKSGSSTERKSVQDQTKDRNHDKRHWEAGKVRTNLNGDVKMHNYNKPKLDNNKLKVEYNRK